MLSAVPDVALSQVVAPAASAAKPVSYMPNTPPVNCGEVLVFFSSVAAELP
ncbi:hypothetical protein D3C85_1688770 [compost metagenome]